MEGKEHPSIFNNYVSETDIYAYKYSETGSFIIYEFFEDKSSIRLKYYLRTDDMKSEPHLGKYKFTSYCWRCCGSNSKDHPDICKH